MAVNTCTNKYSLRIHVQCTCTYTYDYAHTYHSQVGPVALPCLAGLETWTWPSSCVREELAHSHLAHCTGHNANNDNNFERGYGKVLTTCTQPKGPLTDKTDKHTLTRPTSQSQTGTMATLSTHTLPKHTKHRTANHTYTWIVEGACSNMHMYFEKSIP